MGKKIKTSFELLHEKHVFHQPNYSSDIGIFISKGMGTEEINVFHDQNSLATYFGNLVMEHVIPVNESFDGRKVSVTLIIEQIS